jgi:ubiquinone/menaquinone biosynthesis C-methylase UbiE
MSYEINANQNDNTVTIASETGEKITLPRFLLWSEVDKIPLHVLTELNNKCNILEYADASYLHHIKITRENISPWLGQFASRFNISKYEKILDFGTGTGLGRLGLLNDGYKATYGVDVSEECLRRQASTSVELGLSTPEREARQLITFEKFQSQAQEFEHQFSMIALASTLHHIADISGIFRLFRRILKKGGRLVAFSEPINKRKWHALGMSEPPRIDMFEFVGPAGTIPSEKTRSTTYLAEVWDGAGFERKKLSQMLAQEGFRLTEWKPGMWLSYLCHHPARRGLSKPEDQEQLEEFSEIYTEITKLENRLKRVLKPEFFNENSFTVTLVAEAV